MLPMVYFFLLCTRKEGRKEGRGCPLCADARCARRSGTHHKGGSDESAAWCCTGGRQERRGQARATSTREGQGLCASPLVVACEGYTWIKPGTHSNITVECTQRKTGCAVTHRQPPGARPGASHVHPRGSGTVCEPARSLKRRNTRGCCQISRGGHGTRMTYSRGGHGTRRTRNAKDAGRVGRGMTRGRPRTSTATTRGGARTRTASLKGEEEDAERGGHVRRRRADRYRRTGGHEREGRRTRRTRGDLRQAADEHRDDTRQGSNADRVADR